MTFTSYQFFLFLPTALLIYFLIPGKLRTLWLVMTSFAFIWYFNPKYLLVLLVSAGISYGTAHKSSTLSPGRAPKAAAGAMALAS